MSTYKIIIYVSNFIVGISACTLQSMCLNSLSRQRSVKRTQLSVLALRRELHHPKTGLAARASIQDQRIAELMSEVVERDRRVTELATKVADRERRLAELTRKATKQNQRIKELNQHIVEYDQKFVDVITELARIRSCLDCPTDGEVIIAAEAAAAVSKSPDAKSSEVPVCSGKGKLKKVQKRSKKNGSFKPASTGSVQSDEIESIKSMVAEKKETNYKRKADNTSDQVDVLPRKVTLRSGKIFSSRQ